MEDERLPDIEKERLERIQRNREAMRALGVLDAAERVASSLQEEQAAAAAAAAKAIAKYHPSPGAPARRSSRSASKAASQKLAQAAAAHNSEEASELDDEHDVHSEVTSDSSSGPASRKRKVAHPLQPHKHGQSPEKQRQQQQQPEDKEQEYVPTGSDADEEETSSASEGQGTGSEAEELEQLQQRKQRARKRSKSPSAQRRAIHRTAANHAAAAAAAGDGAARKKQQQWVPELTDVQLNYDDWELQLALQLSMQDDNAAAEAYAAGISKPDNQDAVLISDVEAAGATAVVEAAAAAAAAAGEGDGAAGRAVTGQEGQSIGKRQQRQHQQARRGTACQQNLRASSEQQERDSAEMEEAGEMKPCTISGNRRSRKQSSSNKSGTGSNNSRQDWSAADMFDLFALFKPGDNGAIGKSHLLQQMAKAGMEADGELAERMLQYAKELAAKQQAIAGQPQAASNQMQSNKLEYEEFLVLGELMG